MKKNKIYILFLAKVKSQKPVNLDALSKRDKVFSRDGNKCIICNAEESLTIDHILPLSKGGTNKFDNLQCLCRRCNMHKGNKIIINEALKRLIKNKFKNG